MINLEKGERVNLSKEEPNATKFTAGLGWDPRVSDGSEFDLDASALLLDANGKPHNGAEGLVFYNKQASDCGGVISTGDNRTGEGDGDDEQIQIDLDKLDSAVEKILIVVTIHKAKERRQNFGMVDDAFVRVLQGDNDEPVAKYDLTEDFSTATTVVFGEFYKKDGTFRFAAKGDAFDGDLQDFLGNYGL